MFPSALSAAAGSNVLVLTTSLVGRYYYIQYDMYWLVLFLVIVTLIIHTVSFSLRSTMKSKILCKIEHFKDVVLCHPIRYYEEYVVRRNTIGLGFGSVSFLPLAVNGVETSTENCVG